MARGRDFIIVPALLAGAAIGLGWGGYGGYVALHNLSARELTCADYLAERPAATWLRLTACAPDIDRIGVESIVGGGRSEPIATYVALRPPGAAASTRAVIVVEGPPGRADQLALDGPIEGMIEPSWTRSRELRDDLAGMHLGLAEDYVILERGARPRPWWFSLGLLAIGGGSTALFRRWRQRRRAGRPAPLPRATLA
jgi:hypothetical protein